MHKNETTAEFFPFPALSSLEIIGKASVFCLSNKVLSRGKADERLERVDVSVGMNSSTLCRQTVSLLKMAGWRWYSTPAQLRL